jgi:hypothetical protein
MSLSLLAAVTTINDATTIIAALSPLVQQAMKNGQAEISDEDVAASAARLDASIEALDSAIEAARSRT